jgi:glucose-6-phosphate 1-dehydrogenase
MKIADDQAPCHFVIFGASGHLVSTKLLPALYHLEAAGRLPDDLMMVALARRDWDTRAWIDQMGAHLAQHTAADGAVVERLAQRFKYVQGNYGDAQTYERLKVTLGQRHCANLLFYLAIPPADFVVVIRELDRAGLNSDIGQHRIVVEKPFGTDLKSARALNHQLHQHFHEDQVYRIDHYLGKETVQNLLVLRFANSIIEPLWNRNFIQEVQITVAEDAGAGGRAGYFDQSGVLRDMVQNHLLQLLTIVAMEPPPSLEADALRDEKVKVLRSIRPLGPNALDRVATRAQYTAGMINGVSVPGYRQESGVAADSTTETYVALKMFVDNWRWQGVPFYLRSGKRMAQRLSMVAIRFREPPHQIFRETPLADVRPNWMVMTLQPGENIQLEMYARQPGLTMTPRRIRLDAAYRQSGEQRLDAYETLLLDVIRGDRTLFIRFDEVEQAWAAVEPLLQYWSTADAPLLSYPAGSWGPDAADALLASADGWRNAP